MDNPAVKSFAEEVKQNIQNLKSNSEIQDLSKDWLREIHHVKYEYNFSWLGRPIIQMPQDMWAMQEIIWDIKPDLVIETGIAHGGSLIFYASILELIGEEGKVLGIDIDIREHNRREIEQHPMFKRIEMFEGSSIDDGLVERVHGFAKDYKKIIVVLDSNHTHDHVLRELELYSPLVHEGSYLVVFDTLIEDIDEDAFSDKPWGKGNNPKTAVYGFLKTHQRFEIDDDINAKLLLSVAPDGYLRCVND